MDTGSFVSCFLFVVVFTSFAKYGVRDQLLLSLLLLVLFLQLLLWILLVARELD